MSNKPVPSNGFTVTEECAPCPECGYKGCAKIGQQKRCGSCGHQWPPVQRVQQGPTRGEVLNRHGPNPARQLHPMEILKIMELLNPTGRRRDSSPCYRCERIFVARPRSPARWVMSATINGI